MRASGFFKPLMAKAASAAAFHLRFFTLVWLFTAALVMVYAVLTPAAENALASVYLWTIPAYYGVVCGLVMLLTIPIIWNRWLRFLVGVLAWVWLGFLLMDLVVFNLYQFHIDLFLVQMLFADFRGLGLPLPVFLMGLLALGLIALIVRRMFMMSGERSPHKEWLYRLGLLSAIIGLPVFLLNQALHAWADRYDIQQITQYTPYFPLYLPVTASKTVDRIAARFPAIIPEHQEGSESGLSMRKLGASPAGRLNYPKAPLECSPKQKPPIVLLIVESWQADMLNPEVMPNTWRLAQQATLFTRHISSGSATVPGFFGLMYGLHPSYYESFRSQARSYPAPLTEIAHQLGYQLRVFTSGDFDRFNLRSLFFSKVDPANFHSFTSDRELIAGFQRIEAQTPADAPTLDVIFLTSSHSPYFYPPQYQRFTPTPAVKGAYVWNKHIDALPFRNDYKNSLHYVDDEIQKIIAAKKAAGRFDKSWMVVTADHAEEFNESGLGLWGHGSSFSRWQTATPLVVKRPFQNSGHAETKPSFHQDIAPTLLGGALGCRNSPADFSNGFSLFDLPEKRYAVMSSYVSHAYWVDGVVLERNSGRRYGWADMKAGVKGANDPAVLRGLLEEETRFFRP